MAKKTQPAKPLAVPSDAPIDRSGMAKRVQLAIREGTLSPASSPPPAPAQARELPARLLQLEAQPLSAYDDNPVLDERSAAFLVGITADSLKKWRQRKQGPDYIQYGKNGPVRYELNALMEFRDRHRVKIGKKI